MATPATSAPVTAVLAGGETALRRAVEAQDTPVADVCEAPRSGGAATPQAARAGVLAAAARCAAAEPGRWLWLLDGSALPRTDTLRGLLEAELPDAVLLASVVVGGDGEVAPGHAAWFRRGGTDLAMLAARRRLLPIRAARTGSVLVAAHAATAPPGAAGALTWTARLLRDRTGYLVPASVADAAGPGGWRADALGSAPADDARLTAAALRDPAWAPKEKLWLAAEAAGRARAALRR